HRDGYLFLVSRAANEAAFHGNIERQRACGVNVEWLAPGDAARIAPGIDLDRLRGAAWCPDDGVTDPNGVTMGFAKGAQAMGVEIVRGTEVTGVELTGHRVAGVRTTAGTISTPIVVNAAGPWAKSVGRMLGVDVPVEP